MFRLQDKGLSIQFIHRKKFDFIFISYGIRADFLCLIIYNQPLLHAHTRSRANTRTDVRTHVDLPRVHTRKSTQTDATGLKRTHLCTDVRTSHAHRAHKHTHTYTRHTYTHAKFMHTTANARIHAPTHMCMYEEKCACTHSPCFNIC